MSYFECVYILIWVGLAAFIGKKVVVRREVMVLGREERRYSWVFAILVFLPLIIMAANRPNGIGDTTLYRSSFNYAPGTLEEIPAYYNSQTKDAAFYMIAPVVKSIFGPNDVLYFFIIAFFQAFAVLSLYRTYSEDFVFSFALFILSADYLSWMFNGMRQFVAVTIIVMATSLMLKKKYIPLIFLIVFASWFHQTALIMLPIIFIVQGKAWNKRTILFILAMLAIIAFVGSFTNWLDDTLSDTQYRNVVSDYTNNPGDDGTNPLRVLVYSVPAIISFVGRKKIHDQNNPVINLCTNMSIVSAGLYLMSMFTSGIFMGRLPIYTSLYSYVLLPWEFNHIINENYRKLAYGMTVAVYLVFYYYQVHMTWGYF